MTPILLLTGYLGSGKTTLVNRILANKQGIKFAVIVNDIGEVNIDAELIEKGGIVGQKDDSLVALQNGCICCTLKMDLVEQLRDITLMQRFDYIVIEASGICEPAPIAQTICSIPSLSPEYARDCNVQLDSIVTVVDALRLRDEFGSGSSLLRQNLGEDDIENLVIQQVEFCNIIILNKVSEVTPEELDHIRHILRALQPKAEIMECDFGDVDLNRIINTGMFDFDEVATSAAWISEIEKPQDEHDEHEHHHHHHDDDEHEHHHHHDHDEHEHEHHHHHHHLEHGEHCHCPDCQHAHGDEYGIGTYVYFRRKAFNLSLFDEFVAKKWPKTIIRAKGMCWFDDEPDICYVFEQAGRQVSLRNAGAWFATMSQPEIDDLLEREPKVRAEWDDKYGDRMQKIVFIGQNLDRNELKELLDRC